MLLLHRAERTDRLADALAGVLAAPLGDPFAAEAVCVPSKGVERWLAQRLSHRLGRGDGEDRRLRQHPLPLARRSDRAGHAAWRRPVAPGSAGLALLDVIDQCMPEPWCRTVAGYLGAGNDDPVRRGRRYATARHLADLFDSYGLHRPGMLRAWSAGEDVDGLGGHLSDDLCWQAELWRRPGKQMTVPSPAERPEARRSARRSAH